jgi:hypothetical protein
MAIMHSFSNTIADGTNSSIVRPSDWNAAHVGGIEAVGLSASATNVATMGSIFWAGNNITIGLTTNANSSHTISLSGNAAGGGGTLSNYVHPPNWLGNFVNTLSTPISTNITIRYVPIVDAIAFSKVEWPVSIAVASTTNVNASTQQWRHSVVIYSLNGSTLTPLVGAAATSSGTVSSASTASVVGLRMFSIPMATTLTPGDYWVGIQAQTAGQQANTLSHVLASGSLAALPIPFGSSITSTGANSIIPIQGIIAASLSATNNTWNINVVNVGAASWYRANMVFQFKNITY